MLKTQMQARPRRLMWSLLGLKNCQMIGIYCTGKIVVKTLSFLFVPPNTLFACIEVACASVAATSHSQAPVVTQKPSRTIPACTLFIFLPVKLVSPDFIRQVLLYYCAKLAVITLRLELLFHNK